MIDANEPPPSLRDNWPLIAGAVGVLVVLVLFIRSCSPQPASDPELARTARTAVEMADRVERDSQAASLAPARFRLLGVVLGSAVPLLVVAVLIVWLLRSDRAHDRRQPDAKLTSESSQSTSYSPGSDAQSPAPPPPEP